MIKKIGGWSGTAYQNFLCSQIVKLFMSLLLKVEVFTLYKILVDKIHADLLKANLASYVGKFTLRGYFVHIKNLTQQSHIWDEQGTVLE